MGDTNYKTFIVHYLIKEIEFAHIFQGIPYRMLTVLKLIKYLCIVFHAAGVCTVCICTPYWTRVRFWQSVKLDLHKFCFQDNWYVTGLVWMWLKLSKTTQNHFDWCVFWHENFPSVKLNLNLMTKAAVSLYQKLIVKENANQKQFSVLMNTDHTCIYYSFSSSIGKEIASSTSW